MQAKLNIAIIGAGIGGLASASLLARRGHTVTIFDQFDKPRPVGSGLVIQPVGQQVLDVIGIGDLARFKGAKINRMIGHETDHGRRVLDVTYDRGLGGFGLGIHRASLFDLLLTAAKTAGADLIADHKALGQKDGTLSFQAQAPQGPFDLIIDSAGANSPLSTIRSKELPYGAIWSTVNWVETPDFKRETLQQRYRRADRMIGVLPCGSLPGEKTQRAALFWSLPRDGYDAWRAQPLETWRNEARALWPQAAPFIDQITAHTQMSFAQYAHGTLARAYGDRIAHIGDSAHKASPQLGQGANMALLDAWALTRALDQASVEDALRHYAMARRWHVRIYQAMSWAFTPQYQSDSKLLPILRDRMIFPASQIPPVPRLLTKLVCGTLIPPLGSLTPRD